MSALLRAFLFVGLSLSYYPVAAQQSIRERIEKNYEEIMRMKEDRLKKCQRAESKCGGVPNHAYSAMVEEEHVSVLYRGGCLWDAHAFLIGTHGHRRERAIAMYDEMVAIAAARAALQCDQCPSDDFWNSKTSKELEKSASSKAWQRMTKQCRPKPEPEIEMACPETEDEFARFPESNDTPIDLNSLQGITTVLDLAHVADAGRDDNPKQYVRRKGGGRFMLVDSHGATASGGNPFGYAGFTYIDSVGRDAVIVFAPADPPPADWTAKDFEAIAEIMTSPESEQQLHSAASYAVNQARRLQAEGYNVFITGYSLGGALAEVGNRQTGVTTVTFSQVGVPAEAFSEPISGAPGRTTASNLLRIYHKRDIALRTRDLNEEEASGINRPISYDLPENPELVEDIDAHFIPRILGYWETAWDKAAARCAKER